MKRALVVVAMVLAMTALISPMASAAQPSVGDQVVRGLENLFLGWTSVFTEAAKTQNGIDLLLLIPRGAVKAAARTAYAPIEIVTAVCPENAFINPSTRDGATGDQAMRGAENIFLGWTSIGTEAAKTQNGVDLVCLIPRGVMKAAERTGYGAVEVVTSLVPESNFLNPPGPR